MREEREFRADFVELLKCCNGPMGPEIYSGVESGRAIFDKFPAGESSVHPKGDGFDAVFL